MQDEHLKNKKTDLQTTWKSNQGRQLSSCNQKFSKFMFTAEEARWPNHHCTIMMIKFYSYVCFSLCLLFFYSYDDHAKYPEGLVTDVTLTKVQQQSYNYITTTAVQKIPVSYCIFRTKQMRNLIVTCSKYDDVSTKPHDVSPRMAAILNCTQFTNSLQSMRSPKPHKLNKK